jgi:hypothetical protein
MSFYDSINYSIGGLIIMLMFFWFVCKCIGKNQCKDGFVDNTRLVYGNTPMILSKSPIPYIRLNAENVLEVPNSKSAYRHLYDKEIIPCGKDAVKEIKKDKEVLDMSMKKAKVDTFRVPVRLNTERTVQDKTLYNQY